MLKSVSGNSIPLLPGCLCSVYVLPPFFVLFVLTFVKPRGNVTYISLML